LAVGAAGLLLLAAAPRTGDGPASEDLARAAVALLSEDGGADLVNDEVGVATLDPTGLPQRALLISRVSAAGPPRDVVDPASRTNVRYLDRLGRPDVGPDGVLLTVGGRRPSTLTQARFDKPLPVAMHVEYALDGAVVPASDVPGAAGEVSVTYTLTNTDVEQATLEYEDAAGRPVTSRRPVFAPFRGTLAVTLPQGADLVDDGGAVRSTGADGATVLRWNVALYPPISAPVATYTLVMRADRAAVPGAEVLLVPVGQQDPAEDFSDALLGGSTEGNAQLYAGLRELDEGAAALADGSATLAGGLTDLAGGAGQVAGASGALADGVGGLAGGAGALAEASAGLAAGIDDLAGGADDVATGSTQLADALDRAVSGADDLAAATAALAAATRPSGVDYVAPLVSAGQQIEAGLVAAAARVGGPADPVLPLDPPLAPDGDDVCPPDGVAPPDDDCVTIYQGVRLLRDGLAAVNAVANAIEAAADRLHARIEGLHADLESIAGDVATAATGAAELQATLCQASPPALDAASCARLAEVADAASAALRTGAGAAPALAELVAVAEALAAQGRAIATGIDAALASTERLLTGVAALGEALGPGTPDQPGLAGAMAALNAGLVQLGASLADAQGQVAAALAELADGSAALAAGLGSSAAGAGALAAGSSALAEGTDRAATGAGSLASGADSLADGARGAATGADRLAAGAAGLAEGTSGAAAAGDQVAQGALALQQDGTAPATDAVLSTSTDPAEASAWLAAAEARAADALPYGPPEGAVGTVAYRFTLPEVPAPRSLWQRIRDMLG
jgi:putative membrane protein